MSSRDSIHALLDQASDEFHALRGDLAGDRGEQFDSHLATVRMAVDHAADHVENVAADTKEA